MHGEAVVDNDSLEAYLDATVAVGGVVVVVVVVVVVAAAAAAAAGMDWDLREGV